jgi:gas vesicle protein
MATLGGRAAPREDIMGLDDIVDKAKDLAEDAADKAKELAGEAKDVAEDVADKAKDVAGEVKDRADHVIHGDDDGDAPASAPASGGTGM